MIGEGFYEDELESMGLQRRSSPSAEISATNIPTHPKSDNSIGVGIIILYFILGIAFSEIVFRIWRLIRRCRRRAYKGFEKLDSNPPEDSDEELPSMELGSRRKRTMVDINKEERKLIKRVVKANNRGNDIDPLFGKMPGNMKHSGSSEKLSRNEVVLNTSAVLRRDADQATFDVGDASSNEVSSVSEDSSGKSGEGVS